MTYWWGGEGTHTQFSQEKLSQRIFVIWNPPLFWLSNLLSSVFFPILTKLSFLGHFVQRTLLLLLNYKIGGSHWKQISAGSGSDMYLQWTIEWAVILLRLKYISCSVANSNFPTTSQIQRILPLCILLSEENYFRSRWSSRKFHMFQQPVCVKWC